MIAGRVKCIFIVMAAAVALTACSVPASTGKGDSKDSPTTVAENRILKSKIAKLEAVLEEKNQEIAKLKQESNEILTINYIENTTDQRFVDTLTDLLALPSDRSQKLNRIMENTVVQVLDTAEVNTVIWLYVSIPVYDTPSNYKGWVKESETVPYTKNERLRVQSDVTVKKGAVLYETSDFTYIPSMKPKYARGGERRRIIAKSEGYLQLMCPGGETIWIKESSAVYPPVH